MVARVHDWPPPPPPPPPTGDEALAAERRALAATIVDPRIGAFAVVLLPVDLAAPLEVCVAHAPTADLARRLDGALRRLRGELRDDLMTPAPATTGGLGECPACGVVDTLPHVCGEAHEVEVPAWRARRRVHADSPELAAALAVEELEGEDAGQPRELDPDEDGIEAIVTCPDGQAVRVLVRAEVSLDFTAERMPGGKVLQ